MPIQNLPKISRLLADLSSSPDNSNGFVIEACKEFCSISEEHRQDFIFRFREKLDLQQSCINDFRKLKW